MRLEFGRYGVKLQTNALKTEIRVVDCLRVQVRAINSSSYLLSLTFGQLLL
jgi:hypothetical protein